MVSMVAKFRRRRTALLSQVEEKVLCAVGNLHRPFFHSGFVMGEDTILYLISSTLL
jgi:hypothetical protein